MLEGQDSRLELSIVMPCLNECETLEACITKAQGFLRDHGVNGEIVIADNGSTDGSQELAERLGAQVIHVTERGYGNALMGGFASARGKYIVMGDADDSYDFSALLPFLAKLREGYDLVMGNRFKGEIKAKAMPFLHRCLGNPVLTGIGKMFFRCPVGDFHSGLRAFTKEAVQRMGLHTTGMEFASEMVIKATLLGLRITEVPITLYRDGRSRPPHLRSWRDGWRHLRFMLLYSPRWLFLYPGILLMLIGTVLGLWLLPGPRTMGNVTLDVHTLLYMAVLVLVGFQSVSFAVVSKIFALTEGLHPQAANLDKVFRHVTLEAGLVVSLVMIALGLIGSIVGFTFWRSRDFGPLDPQVVMRIALPSAVVFCLGWQVLLTSCLLSVLGIKRK